MHTSMINEGVLQTPVAERCLFGTFGHNSYELARGIEGQHLAALPFVFDQGDSGLTEVIERASMPLRLRQSPLVEATSVMKHPAPRRKPGRKDRHSKIPTLKGLRDRRMRLSLDIARKFFKLQDLLGYDKASKTVKWLMDNARPAIKQLAGSTSRSILPAPRLECEPFPNSDGDGNFSNNKKVMFRGKDELVNRKEKGIMGSMRGVASTAIARESREKARARARERTREKINMKKRLEEESQGSINCLLPFNDFKTSPELVAMTAGLTSCSHEERKQCGMDSDDMIQSSHPSIFDSRKKNRLLPQTDNTLINNSIESGGNWFDELLELSHVDDDDAFLNSEPVLLQNVQSPLQFNDVHFFLWPWEHAPAL